MANLMCRREGRGIFRKKGSKGRKNRAVDAGKKGRGEKVTVNWKDDWKQRKWREKMREMQHYKNTIFINLIAVIFHLILILSK